jgi:hypothetical protein
VAANHALSSGGFAMSSRTLSIVGLVSLPISLALMYFLFMDVYTT